MRRFLLHLAKLDWILLGAVILLFLFGLLTLYASPDERTNFYKQATFGVLALIAIITVSFLDWRIFRDQPVILIGLYILGVALLGVVLLVGYQIRGVASWLSLGTIGIQPAEFIKVVAILVLAKYFSTRHIELYRLRHLLISGLYVLLPTVLIVLQPDLGSAVILVLIWLGLVLLSGIKARGIFIIALVGIIAAAFLWTVALEDYQKERITSFLNPGRDPLGSSYQTHQAIIALGSGGLMGKGLGEGSQTRLGFLPEYESDFIFAAIGEEWGLLGVLTLLALWAIVFWRLYIISRFAPSNFARLFVGGVFILFASHVLVNIGTNLALLPITGLPLPFTSYGGSNLLAFSLALGVLMSIKARAGVLDVQEAPDYTEG